MSAKKKSTKARGLVVTVVLLLVIGPPAFYYYYTSFRQRGVVAWGQIPKALQAEIKIDMENDPTSMQIKQDQSLAFPGSHQQIRIHVGKIKRHYAFIRISLPSHSSSKPILARTHIRKGEQVAFRLGKQAYYINVMKIRKRLVRSSFLELGVGSLNEAQLAGK